MISATPACKWTPRRIRRRQQRRRPHCPLSSLRPHAHGDRQRNDLATSLLHCGKFSFLFFSERARHLQTRFQNRHKQFNLTSEKQRKDGLQQGQLGSKHGRDHSNQHYYTVHFCQSDALEPPSFVARHAFSLSLALALQSSVFSLSLGYNALA